MSAYQDNEIVFLKKKVEQLEKDVRVIVESIQDLYKVSEEIIDILEQGDNP